MHKHDENGRTFHFNDIHLFVSIHKFFSYSWKKKLKKLFSIHISVHNSKKEGKNQNGKCNKKNSISVKISLFPPPFLGVQRAKLFSKIGQQVLSNKSIESNIFEKIVQNDYGVEHVHAIIHIKFVCSKITVWILNFDNRPQ